MNRRAFLRLLGAASAALVVSQAHIVTASPAPAVTVRDPMQTVIYTVKKQTRAARLTHLCPVRQAEYAADSRIYSLAWRTNGQLVALLDRPGIKFATTAAAELVAKQHSLFVDGNVVIAREFPKEG